MSLTKNARTKPKRRRAPGIEVARAQPLHALANQRLYQEGRIAAQAHGELTKQKMIAEFRNPNSTMVGRTTEQWYRMIRDESGKMAVFNSFNLGDPAKRQDESPVGVVRARIDTDTDTRYLESLYVATRDRRKGHGRALFEAVQEWHVGEEFRFRVAASNVGAIAAYEKLQCVPIEEEGLGYEIQGVFVPQIEMISPAVK